MPWTCEHSHGGSRPVRAGIRRTDSPARSGLRATTEEEWQGYIEAVAQGANAGANVAVGELFLPPGVGDVVNGLVAAPEVVKTSLKFWPQTKMLRAVLDHDMAALDRYQAFYSCLASERACDKVAELTQIGRLRQ